MASGKREGLSVRGFASEIGVTENAVRSRIKAGKRIAEAVLEDGSLDPDRARALWWVDLDAANVRSKTKGPAIKDQAEEGLRRATVAAEAEEVALARDKIRLAKEQGALIDREQARRTGVAFARMYRDTVLNFAARRGPELAAKWGIDPRVIIADLDAALRIMLIDLSQEAIPFDPGPNILTAATVELPEPVLTHQPQAVLAPLNTGSITVNVQGMTRAEAQAAIARALGEMSGGANGGT